MTVDELKKQLMELSLEERKQLAAFLVSLRHGELSEYRERMAAKIDDDAEDKWVSFEEFDRRITS